MLSCRSLALGMCLFGLWVAPLKADDWPQWMGPGRDAQWSETGLLNQFPEGGLPVLWRSTVGAGYSGPAVSRGRVFVADYLRRSGDTNNDPNSRNRLEGTERLMCLDAKSGKKIWEYQYDCPYFISYPAGPRATPTVIDDRVYFLGAEGNLSCLDVANGNVIWQKDLKKQYNVESPLWGFSGSPLVIGHRLYCLVGGEGQGVVCFDAKTGAELWKALSSEHAGYCPPTMIRAAQIDQLIIWLPETLNSIHPETGELFWKIPLKPDYGMSIMAPRQSGDYLFASGIGDVGVMLKLSQDKPGATEIWSGRPKKGLYAANTTPFLADEMIYGADIKTGALMGVALLSGERIWQSFAPTTGERRGAHGTAFLVKNHDRYVLFSETGDLIFAKLSPQAYTEISRTHVIKPTGECFGRNVVWSHPAFANRCVFVRNDEEIICYSLSNKPLD